jgi:adenosine deaminase
MQRLPKIELHLHLDCSLSYAVVARLDPSVTPERYEREFIAPPQCTSLADFLTRAPRGFQLMQSEQALRLVVEDLFEQLALDGVVYAEIRFAPLLHTERGMRPAAVVEAVDRATRSCTRSTGIQARLILCTLRHFSAAQGLETARLVESFRGSGVVALDLAGDEKGFAIDAQVPAFRHSIEHGLSRTAHAGEARGAESVWETLEKLQPSRIGHGVRSVEDAPLIDHLRSKRIHLEMCPSSNVQTCAVASYREHPIDSLYRAGVSVGINTDARTITDISLSREYQRLRDQFGWGNQQFLACNLEALGAAFVEDSVKSSLLQKLKDAYSQIAD